MINQKIIISNKEFNLIEKEKKKGKKIVLCHGAFDLVHPGHLSHFEEAKLHGDILVVTVTADSFIKKNLHSPYFNQSTRKKFLENIKLIDHVFVINDETAIPAIKKIKPNFYCKGIEYQKKDNIGNLKIEKKILAKNKGKLIFLGKNVQSSSKLISNKIFNLDNKNLENFLKKINFTKLEEIIEKVKKLKIVVIGETIIDHYTYVRTAGVSPKSNTLSCTETQNQTMPGGSLATYKFLSSFIKNTKHVSIVNKKVFNKKDYSDVFKDSKDILISEHYPKIIKKRIVEGSNDSAFRKILTLNEFSEKELSLIDESKILKKLKKYAVGADLFIIQDFGHGFFTKKIIDFLQKKIKKISINVQTNSLNYGYNIISNKFKRTDFFSLDERELELYVGKKKLNHEKSLKSLSKFLSSKKSFLTCGGKFSLMYSKNKFLKVPILNKKAVDTMGAGDIFHGMASVLSLVSNDDYLTLFMSQVAGAHAVEIIGNSNHPKLREIVETLKFYKSVIEK